MAAVEGIQGQIDLRRLTAWNTDGCRFEGTIFPFFQGEKDDDWPLFLRAVLYLMGLGWLFLGVAVVSDVFMNGIEKITSAKKRVTDKKTGRKVTVYVWNATVANLTLMALGSSAPEILLSIIEIMTADFKLGPLGAGTIVGSAAFNLLCISAVCVAAIPDGEVRYIKQTHVYIITASCSVFAYLWLVFILLFSSKDTCTIPEAVITMMFCPILVFCAYLADRGYCKKKDENEEKEESVTIGEDVTPEELAQIESDIRATYGQNLTDDQVIQIMHSQYFKANSRAWYRHAAMEAKLHGKEIEKPPEFQVQDAFSTSDEAAMEREKREVKFGWASVEYSFLENVGDAKMVIRRAGPTECKASVRYTTVEGTAKAGNDYDPVDKEIVFEKDEVEKTIMVAIKDDASWESDEQFTIKLSDAKICEASSYIAAVIQSHAVTTVNIIDDDAPGELRFEVEDFDIGSGDEDRTEEIVVTRYNGATGDIKCSYYTEQMKSQEGIDFEPTKGVLVLKDGQKKAAIPIKIKGRARVQSATFNLVLKDPFNTKFDAKTDGGVEQCICHITVNFRDKGAILQKMMTKVQSANAIAGHKNWAQQFHDAIFQIGDDDDDDDEDNEGGEEGAVKGATEAWATPMPKATEATGDDEEKPAKEPPSKIDIFMHVISVPWKLLFAFIPPVDYLGGWACFCVALLFIGGVTWMVSDMANLVGCCLGLFPEENAITFVALGTSLPDTFASQTAAKLDPYADASIGNVTGSNSVNVFLGIGLSWTMAAFYWAAHDGDEYTECKIDAGVINLQDCRKATRNGEFRTCAGSIWFDLMVFILNALCALQHLFARRRKWGGELGGPRKGFFGQYFSAGFLVFQWFIYIGASSIWARTAGTALTYTQMSAMDKIPDLLKAFPGMSDSVDFVCPDPYQNDKCTIL
jgi:solute carrier family 8 (sodium/calcium exchanger)